MLNRLWLGLAAVGDCGVLGHAIVFNKYMHDCHDNHTGYLRERSSDSADVSHCSSARGPRVQARLLTLSPATAAGGQGPLRGAGDPIEGV